MRNVNEMGCRRRAMRFGVQVGIAALTAVAAVCILHGGEYPDRWVHVRNDLSSSERLDHFREVIESAAANGYNGVLWDAGIDGEGVDFDGWKGGRLERLGKAKDICRAKSIEIIPMLWSVGRARALVTYDPTLAECQPARSVPYRAGVGKAEFDGENAMVKKNLFGGPVKASATGKRSQTLRIKVKPFRRYRITAHAVQKGFKYTKGEGVNMVSARAAYTLSATPIKDGVYQNSRELATVNSIPDGECDMSLEFLATECDEELISLAIYYIAAAGEVTFSDVNIEEIGIRRPIVRDGAPFAVRDAATGAVYSPGKDYMVPKSDASNPMPEDRDVAIAIPEGSAIKPGTKLLVDLFEPVRRGHRQVGACMANPDLYAYFEKSAPVISELFGNPKKWFLSMDEIRAGGTCGLCRSSGKSLAQLLAHCLERQRDIIRKVRPDAMIYAWCDMYDPVVNAKPLKKGYYMCNGDFSCDGFIAPKDIIAVVWGGQKTALESLEYFSSHGVPTLYASYYDVYSPEHFRVSGAAVTANKIPGCRGLMYTTWLPGGKYDLLGAFADYMKRDSKPMPAGPSFQPAP